MKSNILLPMATVATMATILPLGACAQKDKQQEAPKQPNVIVILADDLGYGDVSAYGSKTINTPNIDKLGKQGVCFTNGYATSATSTPSRYGMMTGMYPWKNENAKILPGDAPLIISEDQNTLPKMFKKGGYVTGAIGKWHLGLGKGKVNWNETIKPGPNEIGFDYSCVIAATVDRVPTVYVENGNVVGLEKNDPIEVDYNNSFEGEATAHKNPELMKLKYAHGHQDAVINGIPRIGYMKGGNKARWIDEDMADYFIDHVKDFISENKEKPFFLYYGIHQPHVPRTPHPRFVGTTTMGSRGDAIVEADWCIGELLATLESNGILENTIIVFSSDNGPVLNDGYLDKAAELVGNHDQNGGLRGGKYSLYDAATRVPFFVYWKDHIKPVVSDALVCQLDFMASFADLLNLDASGATDSENVLPALLGKTYNGRRDLVVEAESRLAYRQGDYIMMPPYKGEVKNLTGNELGNLTEFGLFNIVNDPKQENNLAKKDPDLLEDLKQKFFKKTGKYYKAEVESTTLK